MGREAKVDVVTYDPGAHKFVMILVEEGPWDAQ